MKKEITIYDLKFGNILHQKSSNKYIIVGIEHFKLLVANQIAFNLEYSAIDINEKILVSLGFSEFSKEWYNLSIDEFTIDVYYSSSGGNWFTHLNEERLPISKLHELQNFICTISGKMLSLL